MDVDATQIGNLPPLSRCVVDIEYEWDGSIRSARVASHDPRVTRAMRQAALDLDATAATSGMPLTRGPRIVVTDEDRDALRAHR